MQDAKQVWLGLEEMAALLSLAGELRFKLGAYQHAAQVVKTLGDELAPLVEQDRLRQVSGIGPTLSRQIHELWNTGTSAYLLQLRSQQPEGAGELAQVEGITSRRLRALHDALGIRSVAELRAACAEGRVAKVRGLGPKTQQRLLTASERWLARAESAPPRLLLSRGLELLTGLRHELSRAGATTYLAGAARRGEETLSELELVVLDEVEPALRHLATLRQVVRVDWTRHIAQLSAGVSLKLHGARAARLGNELLLATGNDAHLTALRTRARDAGFELFERDFANEVALYGALGLELVPPELRVGRDEIFRASSTGFAELLELSDIRGMVHCHTTYSDGKNSVMEMALAAEALGMTYLTITDHSPSAHYAGGVSLDRLKQQWDEIAAAQEQVKIRILRGTEADIMSDGSLDFPDAILEQFDVVIASIHARHRMNRSDMTQRITRALSLPLFKIWGHGLGRILNHREPIDCDVLAVLDALASSRGAIELNADPHRLDLPPAWIPAARERDIPFVVSVDAHSTRGLGVLGYGVTMARRGGLDKQQVLNTRSAQDFAALVRPAWLA